MVNGGDSAFADAFAKIPAKVCPDSSSEPRGSAVGPWQASGEDMNHTAGVQPERRRHARIIAKGAVTLLVAGESSRGRLGNLGRGGMLVVSDTPLGSDAELAFEIRFDGREAEWLPGVGRVVSVTSSATGIAFTAPSPRLLHAIDELASASLASARVLSVVLIDTDATRRAAMTAGFRAAGCVVMPVASQLEAIVRLGESSFEPDVIAVSDAGVPAAEMRVFIERDHPNVKLVTIGDELLEPPGIAHWLSSADPAIDLAHRVREVLVRPRRPTQPGVR